MNPYKSCKGQKQYVHIPRAAGDKANHPIKQSRTQIKRVALPDYPASDLLNDKVKQDKRDNVPARLRSMGKPRSEPYTGGTGQDKCQL